MIPAQLILCNGRLFSGVILGFEDVLHQPKITACGGEHTAHKMISAVSMGKGVQSVAGVHAEAVRGDKDGAGGA